MHANFRVRGHLAMEYFTRSLLIVLSVVFGVTGDTVRLTMVTPTPYGAGSSQSSASVSCFRSNPDAYAILSFGRPFKIGLGGSSIQTSTTLPTGSSQSENGQIVTQNLTSSNDATGLFYCEGSSRGLTTRVYSIIHSVNRRFEPSDGLVTKTVNAGEGATFMINSVNSGVNPLWRRIRGGNSTSFDSYNGMHTVTFSSSVVSDGDLFATIQSSLDLEDNHFSMIRVIVRGCAAGKWGPTACEEVCDLCYNGGVCDDETGDCICPPGFSGPNCLTACGMHIFGWGCDFQCGPSTLIQSCTGSQFGLPDPYGNSCISGYKGTHCNIPCTLGTFGAGCSQSCHCQSGICNVYTGACSGISGCAAGWSGTHCQIPDICPVGYYGVNCLSECPCPNNAACDKDTGSCIPSPCSSSLCSFGATCLDTGSSFTCLCQDGRSGITCQYTNDFSIICPSGFDVFGIPGSTVDVMISEPTVLDGITDATFSIKVPPSVSFSAFKSQQQIRIPTSGSATATIEVYALSSSSGTNQYSVCTTSIMVTAFQITCANEVSVLGTTGSNVFVTLPQPTVTEGITDVTFFFVDPQDNQQKSIRNNQYQVTVPVAGLETVNVSVVAYGPASQQNSCTIPITVTVFQITCATNIPVIDTPGSDVSVPIPLPTIPAGVTDVTFNFRDPDNNRLKPLTSSTQYQATIPMSGSTTVDIQVFAYRPSSQQLACTIPITLTGLPYLSQQPIVTVTPTSATVSWQAWGSNVMDTGDGPVIAYTVYYSLTSPIPWTVANNVTVANPPQTWYSSTVQPLQPNTAYMFSVAAVREGPGGEGPMSSVTIKVTLNETEPNTLSPTTTASTIAESRSPVEPTTQFNMIPRSTRASTTVAPNPTPAPSRIVIIVVVAVLAILVIVVLILVVLLVRHYRRRRSREVSVDGLQGKFGSSDHLSSLEAIDNPVSIPLEDVNSNGDVSPEPTATTTTPTPATEKARPKSGTSLISMLDSSSAFAGLPLYPPPERELKKDPIPLKEFVAYMRQAMQGPQLREEWSSFPGIEAICSCDVSQLPDNKIKNRYRNIPAYDHCRVILDHDEEDENLGYINAGYIKGYKNDKAYIATQGPNQATSHDFWKMVWQENVRIIVNGTNLVEDGKNKCHKYWPDVGKAETLGGIVISAHSEKSKGEYTVRTMTIAKEGDKESSPRKIIQFHYTTWPDKDVPKDVTPVLKFVKEFSEATPKDTGPYLIHCSAGVGRTGVIIGIHASLQRARAEKTLDVYNFVADMRDHRVSSVQTPVQYTFIHLALLEALFSDDTAVPAASLGKRVTELKKKKKLAEEFEQLNTITPTPSRERCRNSMANTNQSKNRFPRTLTLEGCRPYLMTPREDGMEYNYINASFVDGFKQRDFAVVTQAPLPNTVLDLWRLVYDYQISSIIMLNAPDPDDTSCPQYWPDKGSEEYGPFTVTTTNTADLDGYRIKQMKLEHRRQKRSHSFKHYQVTDWPLGQEVPKSPSALLRLIQTVDKHKPKDKRSASLVHCIDGLNRSGVFCVLKNSLDRLHEEDVVDILQTTKVLRLNRPNLLNSLDMYRFCYEAMLAYVNNPEEFKAEAIPEPVYENTPRDMEDKPKESIYQNLEPKSSETPET